MLGLYWLSADRNSSVALMIQILKKKKKKGKEPFFPTKKGYSVLHIQYNICLVSQGELKYNPTWIALEQARKSKDKVTLHVEKI